MHLVENTVTREEAVRQRYSASAQHPASELCCPVSYDPRLLEAIPREVVERDYGCGDPSRHLRPGEVVLDLGSGAGKACFIASQVVGSTGRVIGIDMNDDMLEVARRNAPEVAAHIGYGNVDFRKGKIQDLALDLEELGRRLHEHPVRSVEDLAKLERVAAQLRAAEPLIPDSSIDVVISNCVLNLVRPEDSRRHTSTQDVAVIVLDLPERAAIDDRLLPLPAWALLALIRRNRNAAKLDALNRPPGFFLPLQDGDTVKPGGFEPFEKPIFTECPGDAATPEFRIGLQMGRYIFIADDVGDHRPPAAAKHAEYLRKQLLWGQPDRSGSGKAPENCRSSP